MLDTSIARSVIDHAISLGADFAELFIERNQINNISTLSSEVQAVQSGIDFGIGVRVVYGTKVLYGYTNRTESDELCRIVTELSAMDLRDPETAVARFDFSTPKRHSPCRTNAHQRIRGREQSGVSVESGPRSPCGQQYDFPDSWWLFATRTIRRDLH